MLRERYEPMNLFVLVPLLSLVLDPVSTQLDRVLDDDTLFQAVKVDMARRGPRTRTDGRPSTPVEVILRLLVVKHLYGWSYEATERWGSDSLVLRQCSGSLRRQCRMIPRCCAGRTSSSPRPSIGCSPLSCSWPVAEGHPWPEAANRWGGGRYHHSSPHR
jgi:hypothetical protein